MILALMPRSVRAMVWRIPLRRKLQFNSNLIALVTALVVSVVFVGHRLDALRKDHLDDAIALNRILAENSAGPVAFQDSSAAAAVLASLRAKRSVTGAVIDLPNRHDFAVYGTPPPAAERLPYGTASRFRGWVLYTAFPVGDIENRGATLQLVSDLRPEMWETLRAVLLALAVSVALAITLSYFASIRLRTFILNPIEALRSATQRVSKDIDDNFRAPVVSSDELGDLTAAFNRMLDRLQSAHSELRTINTSLTTEIAERRRLERALVDTSRQAGMAEVATGILHNVGNVLNSVNISTQLLRENLDRSQLRNLNRAADLIKTQGDQFAHYIIEDPRGRLLPQFLVGVATALTAEQAAAREELAQLATNIEHIKEIVAAQQEFATKVGITERLTPRELFDEAERIAQASVLRHGVELTHDYADTPAVHVDRHRLLQVLINFITNAIHAVKPNAPGNRRILLRIAPHERGVSFSVIDNGVGISSEQLKLIFTHGYTTRREGHGFGLHSGAIAARLLGGQLRAASDGAGRGAVFSLDLPFESGTVSHEVSLELAATLL